jgi:hypothetical protein
MRRVDRSELYLWETVTVRSYRRRLYSCGGSSYLIQHLGNLSLVVSTCFRSQEDFGP